jgi:hypothetical protein
MPFTKGGFDGRKIISHMAANAGSRDDNFA